MADVGPVLPTTTTTNTTATTTTNGIGTGTSPSIEPAEAQEGGRPPRYVYSLRVDPDQNDRATEIKLWSTARPHMRAFHCAWITFFTGFFVWFSATAVLPEIQQSLHLSRTQIWRSTIASDAGTIVLRWLLGPVCDVYAARLPMAFVLCLAAVPTALLSVVRTSRGLSLARFFVGGTAGSTFVMCQYWTSRMFAREVAGSANAIVAGWGNLGGGVSQLVLGYFLFPALERRYNGDSETAWRVLFAFPTALALAAGLSIVFLSDDAPQGYYRDMKATGLMDLRDGASFKTWSNQRNALLLGVQYAASFGVEITMNNAATFYFRDVFGLNTPDAAAVSFIFGSMNLFARAAGGMLSDYSYHRRGIQGRLAVQTISLILQGIGTIVFAFCTTLESAIAAMIVFSCFVQATEGAIFGVVPHINSSITGYLAGVVSAGGNLGGIAFSICFSHLSYRTSFVVMGVSAVLSSVLSLFIHLPGQSGLLWGKDIVHETVRC